MKILNGNDMHRLTWFVFSVTTALFVSSFAAEPPKRKVVGDIEHINTSLLALAKPGGRTLMVVKGYEAEALKLQQLIWTNLPSDQDRKFAKIRWYKSTADLAKAAKKIRLEPTLVTSLTNHTCQPVKRPAAECASWTNSNGATFWQKIIYTPQAARDCVWDGSTNSCLSVFGTIGTLKRFKSEEACRRGYGEDYTESVSGTYCP